MATLFDANGSKEDVWVSLDGDQPVPAGQDIIVSLDYFNENKDTLLGRNDGKLGVRLEAGEEVQALTDNLSVIDLVELSFPSFADGRSYSKARWLRDLHTYSGDIRAEGDVRIDQVDHLKRCGFSSWLVSHEATISALETGQDPSLPVHYQPAIGVEAAFEGYAWRRLRS